MLPVIPRLTILLALATLAQAAPPTDCAAAEAYYQAALAKTPSLPALWNDAANHYLVCGQPAKAAAFFEKLLAVQPAHVNANLQLARISTDRKQYAKALACLSRVAESNPAIRLLRAEALLGAGKRDAALALISQLRRDTAGDPRVLFSSGLVLAKTGEFAQAEEAFQTVLAQHPDDYEVLFNLGRAAARAAHYDRAQRALESALAQRPNDVDAMFELGRVAASRKETERAVFLLGTARRNAPARAEIALALARALEDGGYYADSARAYDDYLALQPNDKEARRDRGLVYGLTGTRIDEGLRELESYTRANPSDATGHYDLGMLYAFADSTKAIARFDTAIRLRPDFAAARFARALLLHRLGRTPESLPDLLTVLKSDPRDVRALDQLGLAYITLDKPSDAERVLRQALALSPDEPEVLMHLGRALMDLGREEEAKTHLERFQAVRPATARTHENVQLLAFLDLTPAQRRERFEASLRRAIETRPGDPELKLRLAKHLLDQGKPEEADAVWRQLFALNPPAAMARDAGVTLLRAARFELARDFLQLAGARLDLATAVLAIDGPEAALKVLDEIPAAEREGDYLLVKARVLDAAGRSAEAADLLAEGLRRTPARRPELVIQTAAFLVRLERHAAALDILDRSLAVQSAQPDLQLTRALVLAVMNRDADAEAALLRLEAQWPEWDRPYVAHALLLQRRARPDEARRKMQTATVLGARDTPAGLREMLLPAR